MDRMPPPPPPSSKRMVPPPPPKRVAERSPRVNTVTHEVRTFASRSKGHARVSRLWARAVLGVLVIGAVVGGLSILRSGSPVAEASALQSAPAVPACGGKAPADRELQTFAGPPAFELDPKHDYVAVIHTSCGDIKMDLLEQRTPVAVANFVFLAQQGFYDGLEWHEIAPNAIIQAGDPNSLNGVSPDGPGYTIRDELRPSDRYVYGTVGMANTGEPHTAGSQFFIVTHDLAGAVRGQPSELSIEPRYTIFGKVYPRFYGSVAAIAEQPIEGNDDQALASRPTSPIYIEQIEILKR